MSNNISTFTYVHVDRCDLKRADGHAIECNQRHVMSWDLHNIVLGVRCHHDESHAVAFAFVNVNDRVRVLAEI